MENLLKVDDLKTYFKTHIGDVQAVRGISLYVNKGEALGIVGESGCGKTTITKLINGLIPHFVEGGTLSGTTIVNGMNVA